MGSENSSVVTHQCEFSDFGGVPALYKNTPCLHEHTLKYDKASRYSLASKSLEKLVLYISL